MLPISKSRTGNEGLFVHAVKAPTFEKEVVFISLDSGLDPEGARIGQILSRSSSSCRTSDTHVFHAEPRLSGAELDLDVYQET